MTTRARARKRNSTNPPKPPRKPAKRVNDATRPTRPPKATPEQRAAAKEQAQAAKAAERQRLKDAAVAAKEREAQEKRLAAADAKAAREAQKIKDAEERARAKEEARHLSELRIAERDAEKSAKALARAEAKITDAANRDRIKRIKREASNAGRITKGIGGSAAKDRAWVDQIIDPRQRALAHAIPAICDIFGMSPDDLIGRTSAISPAEMVINSNRKACTGAIIYLGLELGIRWNALHGRPAAVGQSGETEIRDLIDAHRQSLASFRLQFCALTGLPVSDENPVAGMPMGEIGQLVRARFSPIRATAFAEVGMAHERPTEDDEGVAA